MIDVLVFCLALNVYFEARGEPIQGQIAVAEVTLRRADLSGRPVCQEVFLDRQFSWNHTLMRPRVTNSKAWLQAQNVAAAAMLTETDHSKGATHFHHKSIKPSWSRKLCRTTAIGNHVFYSTCGVTQR